MIIVRDLKFIPGQVARVEVNLRVLSGDKVDCFIAVLGHEIERKARIHELKHVPGNNGCDIAVIMRFYLVEHLAPLDDAVFGDKGVVLDE